MHVVSIEEESPFLVMVLVDEKVGGEAGKVEMDMDSDGTVEVLVTEAVGIDDEPVVKLGSSNVDSGSLGSPKLVCASDVLVVFVQWTELLSMELNEMVAVPVVFMFGTKVDDKTEDEPPDSHERVLDWVLETFDEAESGFCDVSGVWVDVIDADEFETDVTDEVKVGDPGSEDAVPVLEAGSSVDGFVPPLPMLAVVDEVSEAGSNDDGSVPLLLFGPCDVCDV